MEHCRAAERALVAALVLGEVDPAELAGRLHPRDFTDPAAGACFAAALEHGRYGAITDLTEVLRSRGALRSDGYPIRELLEWLPTLPVPAHPQAWATLVVAGSLGRVVQACGLRLVQAVESAAGRPEAGRVLTVAAVQRAALHGAGRRWDALPASWRDTVPPPVPHLLPTPAAADELVEGPGRQRELEILAGLVAAPKLLDRLPWLRVEDFTDPSGARVFDTLRRLHTAGRPVDLVTLAAAVRPAPRTSPSRASSSEVSDLVAVCQGLRPDRAVPAMVPFLARRMVQDAAIRQARGAGEELLTLAGAPGSAGGLGRPMVDAALVRLDQLRSYAERLEQAQRPAPSGSADRTRAASRRVPDPRASFAADRHVG